MNEKKKTLIHSPILLLDALVNLFLGIVLLVFSDGIVTIFGLPGAQTSFYPNILGAIFIGITIALITEYFRRPGMFVGLGLGGAVAINLCGGTVLALWLILGNLELPIQGYIILWSLVILLIGISLAELTMQQMKRND